MAEICGVVAANILLIDWDNRTTASSITVSNYRVLAKAIGDSLVWILCYRNGN